MPLLLDQDLDTHRGHIFIVQKSPAMLAVQNGFQQTQHLNRFVLEVPTQLACQGHQIWCGRAGVPMLSQQPQELMHPARPALPKENIQSNSDVNWFLSTTLQTHYTGQVICEPQVIPCPRWDNSPGKS